MRKRRFLQSKSRLEMTSEIPRTAMKAVLLLALLAGTGCRKAAAPQPAPLPVNVVTAVEKQVNEWDEFTGRLEAVESVEIRPRVSGYITEIRFQAGAIIKKDDLLYVIDPRPYQADFDRAAAEVERMQAQEKLAQIELDRAKELRAKNTISASEFDQKAATYQGASAATASAVAAKNAAALNLEFTQVKSPIDGRVSDERITLGNLVQPGAGPENVLTTVVSVDPIYAKVDADENAILKYVKLSEEGKRVSARTAKIPAWVELGNETDFPHQGYVDFVDNRLDPGTGTVRARVVLKNWNPNLITPGFFVRIRVAGATPYRAALIADKVISSQQGVKYVFVVKPDNTIERRNLETGKHFRRQTDRKERAQRWRESCLHAPAAAATGNESYTGAGRSHQLDRRRSRAPLHPKTQNDGELGRGANAVNFPHFFIDRPIFAGVISIVITLVGVIALSTLPIAQYPEIAPPTIQVTATYPGANAKVVSETVATPIEQQVNGVENMLYMSSQSTSDGNMTLSITFKLGTNLDTAQVLVQNRVAIAIPILPPDVQRIGVTTKKQSPDITMVVHLVSPDGSLDQLFTSNYALLQVRDELARLDGVGDINVFGAREYSMRIWLDPNKIAARDLTAQDVVQALQEQNVQVAAGIIGAPPVPKGATAFQYTVSTQGRLADEKEFGDIVVKTGANGQVTRVRDIARVELAARDYTVNSGLGGKPATAIAIFQLPGSNALATSDAVRKKMAELKQRFPAGLDYTIVYDPTVSVRESIHEVQKTLFEAIALVVLVVLVFLQTWRAAIIPLIAIPVSLIGTFAAMKAFGFSINNISLFGLVLAIGIVVDDAIVVVEAIEHHIEDGLSPRDAARKAMTEVGGALVAIALVLCSVFIPTAFISGITGQFFRQFALTIAVSTAISALNSLTLSPALAALLLRPRGAEKDSFQRLIDGAARLVLQGIQQSLRVELELLWQHRRTTYSTRRHRSAYLRRFTRADRSRFQNCARRFSADAGSRLRRRLRTVARRGIARSHPGRGRQDHKDRTRNARGPQHR